MIYDRCCHEVFTCDTDPYNYTQHLDDISPLTIATGVLMTVGTFASVVPQMVKFCRAKSVLGVSFAALIISSFNQWSYVINLLTANISKIMALTQDPARTLQNEIPFIAALVLFMSYGTTMLQYIFYHFRDVGCSITYKRNVYLLVTFVGYLVATLSSMLGVSIVLGSCNAMVKVFSGVFGAVSAALTCVQWIPQIIATYRLKSPGSFSLAAMLIQCPGCAVSMAVTIASYNPWYVCLSWLCSFSLELILVILLIVYTCRGKRKKQHTQQEAEEQLVSTDNTNQNSSRLTV